MNTIRTIVIPAALVAAARNIGECLTPAAAGMFVVPLSSTGALPATHYVSSGLIDASFLALLADSILLFQTASQGAQQQGLTLTATQVDCDNLVAQSVVSEEPPFDLFARLNLMMVTI